MLDLDLVVVVLVVGMESLQVVNLLDILHLVLNTRVGGVVALRWRGGMVHGLSFVVFVLVQLERVGSLVLVTMVVFVVVALIGVMICVDAKRAPSAKHIASRTKLASHAQRITRRNSQFFLKINKRQSS
jgi:hypothetical protein